VRGTLRESEPVDTPPRPKFATANFDLSPQAGRGEGVRRVSTALSAMPRGGSRNYRLAGDAALAATRVSVGVAAILTSTSLTGSSVQACVT
jgi:hypothetical protein